jgi:ectoine hydroxylase
VKLTPEQIRQFEEEGYFFLPGCFSDEEVAVLRDEAEEIYKSNREEVWWEKTGAPRTAFAAHTYNEAFRLLGAHPRLVEPLEQIFGEGVYTHQFKSTRRRRSRATSGNGTRITAPGRATTACPSRAR